MTHRLALYPGTFDPITNGHMDVLQRALPLFDEIEVTVAVNREKRFMLSLEERVELVRACVRDFPRVKVGMFEGLLVEYARRRKAVALIRGLRQVSDFDYEFRMAFANRRLCPEVETVFLMTSEAHAFISSSIVREIYHWGGDISSFVPPPVVELLSQKRANL